MGRRHFAAVLLAALVAAQGGAGAAHAAPLTLLDARGWEMVSPPEKNGGEVAPPEALFGGGDLQAAANGEAATFSSASSFGPEVKSAPAASQYLSQRTPSGWVTENLTPASFAGAYGEEPAGTPFRIFSTDLSRALVLEGQSCAEEPGCPRGYSLRQGSTATPSPQAPDLKLAGASPDLRHVVFSTCAALTLDATEVPDGKGGCEPAATNLYAWGEGELRLLNVLPGESHGTPGALLAAPVGAVSEDGSRVYFTLLEDGPIYLSEAGKEAKLLPETQGGGASFQAASADGAIAYFTKGGTLYRYSAQGETSEAIASGVIGVAGASENGSSVYYLTTSGLFLWQGGEAKKVAESADPSSYPPSTSTAHLSPDGTRLAFLSDEPLTGYDNTDRNTGEADAELFLYDATANGGTGQLRCASCRPDGTRPEGPASVPGTVANGTGPLGMRLYRPRVLVDGGRRLFFDSRDSLVSQDTNNDRDAYEWEEQGTGSCAQAGGCADLISSGRSEEGASFIDASQDGRDAFFLTDGSLVPSDPGALDLYDAREGGGFPVPEAPIPCEGDACQPLPSPPEDPIPGTAVPTEGNPPVRFKAQGEKKQGKGKKGHHKGKKHHKRDRHYGGHK